MSVGVRGHMVSPFNVVDSGWWEVTGSSVVPSAGRRVSPVSTAALATPCWWVVVRLITR